MKAFLIAAVLCLFATYAEAACPTLSSTSTRITWVSVVTCGAVGNGVADDTAAIQAAIDFAFANNLTGVYCPEGDYKTSSTIYLDPPGNLRTNLANPTMFGFQMAFFGDPAGGGGTSLSGCRLHPTFTNNIAFLLGTGQGMELSNVAIIQSGYRGELSSSGVGVGTAGGNGGSSRNLISSVYVAGFYSSFKTDANGGCCLAESTTFRKVTGIDGRYCVWFNGSQTDINVVDEPTFHCTSGVYSPVGKQVTVIGGDISGGDSGGGTNGASFSISGTTGLVGPFPGPYTFTTVIASPDAKINTVYNSYMILTTHFGVLPLTLTNWNSGTSTATFQIFDYSYGTLDLSNGGATDLTAEIEAVGTLYAAERVSVYQGMGIHAISPHIENQSCTTLLNYDVGATNDGELAVKDAYFNYDAGLTSAATSGTPAILAQFYCQQVFPFITADPSSFNIALTIDGGSFGSNLTAGGVVQAPMLIESSPYGQLVGSKLEFFTGGFNYRVSASGNWTQISSSFFLETVGRGVGTWDQNYFLPLSQSPAVNPYSYMMNVGELKAPTCGYEPCPWTMPQLSPTIFALVCPGTIAGGATVGSAITCSGSLGSLGNYPPIACRTVYRSLDWNTTANTAPGNTATGPLFRRSASCPGYTWGQNLTNAVVGGTVTWSYKGQSDTLYLDAKTLEWMFPGLGISINNGSGAVSYIVTGIHPQLGYITVMNATSNAGGPLVGTKTTVYQCTSSCTVGQASFAWSAY